jgi:hypothetical protein
MVRTAVKKTVNQIHSIRREVSGKEEGRKRRTGEELDPNESLESVEVLAPSQDVVEVYVDRMLS